ncbi:hypothetical protein V6N11_042687 [Hibiscus sabdariffa]|uniref:Uncharacterized protein n=1 Tax=Hibiscus sabdariffa TaxID=183260 RepID=A0ABR2QXI5_9ROSI
MITLKKNRQTIRSITNGQGQVLDTFSQISDEAISYFKQILGAKDDDVSGCFVSLFKDILGTVFSEEAKLALGRRVSREEICTSIPKLADAYSPDSVIASSSGKEVHDLWAFYLHSALLRQAFVHCEKFLIAASGRSLGRASVPV